ncbi:Outer membrane vitamin B12 receptor BtuB [Sphingobium herbicidovorans NBRC 16415]|uniref:Outer membrane vitamin B12 receptor BtuB n=1 Tax=Sphingobium herbicidovorans (strain ATCC 700291 / DSM 11019 / CCUG 56400 / KCTC 2939 / LMG 18315 / NBRC 16415 / MH) TaxID=1219045 RepID=A0A086P736_SPHHM|nr:TonB-dependent receptor [Sphingobium herbicidovorans]KFG89204.1 Outer membrane vitamin B12 receptor BtuB [Sphingobium herbicidovorans NBRC 16415]
MLKIGISLVALLAATPALAEQSDSIVVTALGIEQPRDEVGQAVSVIDAQTIETRQNVSVADLIATTPGVRFNRADAVGGVTGISIRGAETTQTLVLLDGVKINDPSGIGDAYDFGNLLTGNIRRIEILRGSNSVVYGSQAIGGVINIMTGEPGDGFGGSASVDYGYADTVNAKADVSGSSGIVAGSAGAAWFRTDGISAAQGGTEKDGYENIAAHAKLKLSLADNLSLDLRGYYIHADLDTDIFFAEPMESTDSSKLNQYIGYAGINLTLFEGKLTQRAAVTWFRNDRDYFSSFGDYGYSGTNLRFEYEGVYQPVDQAKLVFGYEHESPDYDFYGFGSGGAKANIDSVFALAVVKPFTGLSLTGGVRHDDHSQFGGATTFGANANYTPNGGATNIRSSYGEGFKAPSLYQLYDGFNGNPALQPERSKSYDIGFDQSLDGGRALFSITAFRRDTRDQIYFDGVIPPFGQYINLTRTRAKGVEAAVTLKPVDALTVTAAYSYIDAVDRSEGGINEGKLLPRRAKDAVSVSADYIWSFGLSAGATLTMVGDSFNDAANTQSLDGYALMGVRASLPITGSLEIYGRIDNLFDEEYATVYGYNTYGRSAYGGVRVRF